MSPSRRAAFVHLATQMARHLALHRPALGCASTLNRMEQELFEYYLGDMSRRGSVADGAFTGAAGGAACGDLSRISFLVEEGRITSVTGEAGVAGAPLAATAAVAETIDGAPVLDAGSLSID